MKNLIDKSKSEAVFKSGYRNAFINRALTEDEKLIVQICYNQYLKNPDLDFSTVFITMTDFWIAGGEVYDLEKTQDLVKNSISSLMKIIITELVTIEREGEKTIGELWYHFIHSAIYYDPDIALGKRPKPKNNKVFFTQYEEIVSKKLNATPDDIKCQLLAIVEFNENIKELATLYVTNFFED